jgi:serine/threonine-protein kinase
MVAGRYRIVGLLGRGGMGEVYRADDLKLGQIVALKFLPPGERDPARLEMLLDEVRLARRVAHPNVCRVYDIGEESGRHFLSKEYVDGEDLATLLRRIGRLPRDKANQVARQLCAGLAAAHDQRILHRDLKPANVMIDGRGRAKITDFGLAREAQSVEGRAAADGTPAYMAPEQLAGQEASQSSDIYALGLVLYELFTGKRPFESLRYEEALRERSSGPPSSLSRRVESLDPATERVVLRCLGAEPAERPASALEVAAALPGADPLAAALAAGETPSPAMVAAAPTKAVLRPAVAVAGVVFCLAIVLLGQWLEHRRVLAPGGRSPIVLADRAGEILRELGHAVDSHDSAWGYVRQPLPAAKPLFDRAEAERIRAGAAPPYFTFWYRSDPNPLMPLVAVETSATDPPRGSPASAMALLDGDGRLVGLEVWPVGRAEAGSAAEGERSESPSWDTVLALTGFDVSTLTPTETTGEPPMYATSLATWIGSYPGGLDLRIEAAAIGDRVHWLRVFSPQLGDPTLVAQALPKVFIGLLYLLFAGILVTGAWLARSNLRSGAGDRRGAWRVALVVGGSTLLAGFLSATHRPVISEITVGFRILRGSVIYTVFTGMFYLGLEPVLRRNWPHRLVAWSRILEGRFKDPLVGLHLLVGSALAVVLAYADEFGLYLGGMAGLAPHTWTVLAPPEIGWRVANVIAHWPASLAAGILMAFGFATLLYAVARAVRHELLGGILVALMMAFGLALRDQITHPGILVGLIVSTSLYVVVMLRLGLAATVTGMVLSTLILLYPTTTWGGSWVTNGSTVLALTVPVVAAFGAWMATRGTRLDPGRGIAK